MGIMRTQSAPFSLVALALTGVALLPTLASAQAAPPPPPKQEGSAELAFVGTSGNSSTSTFSLGAEYITRPTNWVIKNRALLVRSTAEGTTTAESLLYALRAERRITERVAGFGELGLFRDQPAGIDSRAAVTGGLAFKLLETERAKFGADAGAGYINEHRIVGDDISSAIVGAGTDLRLKLSDTADLGDEVRFTSILDNGDDWRLTHTVAVTAKLTTVLSLKASNQVRYANFPPPGFKKTDTTTAVALVVSFKRQ